MTVELRHDELHLVLERLQGADGTPLLLLHALGGCRADWDVTALAWNTPTSTPLMRSTRQRFTCCAVSEPKTML